MKTNADKVARMMAAFGQCVPVRPTLPDAATVELRAALISEEYLEVIDAINTKQTDIEHIVKELCDLLFVTYGTILSYGVNPDFAFNLVYKSNMSKIGINGVPEKAPNGKVLKGAHYRSPDMFLIHTVENI